MKNKIKRSLEIRLKEYYKKSIYDMPYPTKKIEGNDIEDAIGEHSVSATGLSKRMVYEFDLKV